MLEGLLIVCVGIGCFIAGALVWRLFTEDRIILIRLQNELSRQVDEYKLELANGKDARERAEKLEKEFNSYTAEMEQEQQSIMRAVNDILLGTTTDNPLNSNPVKED